MPRKPNPTPEEERARLYTTRHWRRVRKQHLAQHPFCVDCGCKANVVDHFMGHADDGWRERFWDPAYFASRCAICHNKKTQAFDMPLRNQMKKASPKAGQMTAMELAIARLTGTLKA